MGKYFAKEEKQQVTNSTGTTSITGTTSSTGTTGVSGASYLFRAVLIGPDGSGKSSLIERYVNNKFKDNGTSVTVTSQFIEKNGIKIGSNAI